MRILVCGGRDYVDRARVFKELDALTIDDGDMMPRNGTVISHGACPTGADRWADEWAIVNRVPVQAYPADWGKHQRAAGPIRNSEMLRDFKPDVVVVLPGGRGTNDMWKKAMRAGVRVIEIPA